MVDAVSSAVSAQTSASNSSAQLAQDFDTFLTLLTAQLQNQDPLSPTDTTEFTNQLVQFASVEQQIQSNQTLSDLVSLTRSSTAAGLSGYLGKTAEVNSPRADLSEGQIEWLYELPEGVEEATLSVRSEAGTIIYSQVLDDVSAGSREFVWDGRLSTGEYAESGQFSLIISAADEAEDPVTVSPRVRTTVTGVDLSGESTQISTKSGTYDFDAVLRLAEVG